MIIIVGEKNGGRQGFSSARGPPRNGHRCHMVRYTRPMAPLVPPPWPSGPCTDCTHFNTPHPTGRDPPHSKSFQLTGIGLITQWIKGQTIMAIVTDKKEQRSNTVDRLEWFQFTPLSFLCKMIRKKLNIFTKKLIHGQVTSGLVFQNLDLIHLQFNSIADDVIKLKRSFFHRVKKYHSYRRYHFPNLTIDRTN